MTTGTMMSKSTNGGSESMMSEGGGGLDFKKYGKGIEGCIREMEQKVEDKPGWTMA